MKIAFLLQPISTMSPPNPDDSIAIWTYEIARRLARHCDVVVFAIRGRNQKEFECHDGVKYYRIRAVVDQKFALFASVVDNRLLRISNFKRPLFASGLYYRSYALQAARYLRSEKCDIVHILNFSQFVPVIRALNPKIRIVLHMHCEWLTQLDRAIIEGRIRKVDLIIHCSEYNSQKVRHCFPEVARRCETLYNGVDVGHFIGEDARNIAKRDGGKRLLFVGRVSPEKGLHVLLDAFSKVVECFPQAHLEIVGPESIVPFGFIVALSDSDRVYELGSFYNKSSKHPYLLHLQKQLLSLNIANKVTFTGSIPYRHVVNNYRDADLFANSSFSESFPLPILEAMASRLPIVATRVGGIPEAVSNGETGLLVEPGDASALAEAIIRLLVDEDLRKSMGKAARKRAIELFSWERVAERLLLFYKKISDADD